MCTPQCIFDKLGGLAFDEAVKSGKYVLHYAKNLKNLQDEMIHLDNRRECIHIKVCEAIDNGKEIMPDVKTWQTEADDLKNDVDKLMEESAAMGNMHCIACSCPNIKWRHRLSKQAEQKIQDVKELTKKGHFEEIAHRRPPPPELEALSKNYVNFDSRIPIINKIVNALQESSVNMIGVYGPGGVGKTSLALEVAEKMRRDGTFKQVSRATIPKGLTVEEIQSQLADGLNFKFDPNTDKMGSRAIQLWNKLTNGDKYLIILDDIWEKLNIMAIGIPITDVNKKCKVLLTSRDKDLLLIKMKADSFAIEELPEAEAWDLFKKKVGNFFESDSEINSIAHVVCKRCRGLPVAINTIGAALEGKLVHVWKDALVKLERYELMDIEGIDPSVWASLRLSYDFLSPNAKSCFLLCCLFREDAEIQISDLTRHCLARRLLSQNPRTLEEVRNSVCTVIGSLKSASLLLDSSGNDFVRVHDIIREVGISIAREEKAFCVEHGALHWPENPIDGPSYSAISLISGRIEALPTELTCPKLHTLMFENSKLSDLEVPDEFFSGMTQLSVLILTRIRMRKLPSSLGKLANLRMLYLIECDLADIDILGDLNKSLEVLSLRGSSIQALPPKIGQLTRLRVLDLEECNELKVIPQGVVSKLTDLEELYFPSRFYEGEATTNKKQDASSSNNVNLEELRLSLTRGKLTVLHIRIPDVELLPKEGLKFENLKRFRVSVGSKFKYYQDFSAATRVLKYEGTRVLKYEGISLRNEFIPLVDNAEMLYLSGIKGLKKVLHDSGVRKGFLDLEHLEVTSCDDDLEYLLGEPKSSVQSHGQNLLHSFNKLTVLLIDRCKLKYLFSPTIAKGLVHLEQLEVKSCEIMEGIVGFEEQNDINEHVGEVKFDKLKRLELRNLPNLITFCAKKEKTRTTMGSSSAHPLPLFDEKVIFPVLERLDISEMGILIQIWDKQSIEVLEKQGSFCQLMAMNVKDCAQLTNVFPSKMHSPLKNLKELQVEGCGIMKGIVEFEGEIDEDGPIDEICFSKLIKLIFKDLPSLVSFCTKLGTVGTTNGNATIRTQPLFNKKVIFPILEILYIGEMGNLIQIWDKQSIAVLEEQGSFCQLKNVIVDNCTQLTHVFPSKMHALIKNLKELVVRKCGIMEGIVEFEGEIDEDRPIDEVCFNKLIELQLYRLPNLVSFCTKSGTVGTANGNATILFNKKVIFPVLERLAIRMMGNLTKIWDKQSIAILKEQGSFCQLMDVNVSSCAQLTHVFPSKMSALLKNLKELCVEDCGTMKGIVEFEGEIEVCFSKLSNLSLEDLPNLESFCTELRTAGTTNGNATILAQPLFNEKVAFPALEKLTISDVPNITEIWDKKSLPESEKETLSFCKLRDIDIRFCNQLVYVLPSYMLPQLQINLQKLSISECEEMEVIVSKELKGKEATDNEIIVFHQLKDVWFRGLPKLKSFYTGTELLFSHKVAFPSLKHLYIVGLPKIKEIWPYKQPLPEPGKETESFYKLSFIGVDGCHQLVYVFPFYILRQLQHLENLWIRDCKNLEVIVSKELKEKEVIHNDIVFPQLKTVQLRILPNLKRFCSETQLFFSDKDVFPVLKDIRLTNELKFLQNGTSTKEECGTSGKENEHNGEED